MEKDKAARNELARVTQRGQESETLWLASLSRLLCHWCALYAPGSGSLRTETVRELLASLRFLLQACGESRGCPVEALPAAELEDAAREGMAVVRRRLAYAKRLYQAVCVQLPETENRALRDTLRELGAFFRRYDGRFFAHQTPCDIDYQLLRPVEERLKGVDYVTEYCKRLAVESAVLSAVPTAARQRLLGAVNPRWREDVGNLCELALPALLGKTLLGGSITEPLFSRAERTAVGALLRAPDAAARKARLADAGEALAERLGLHSTFARAYLAAAAREAESPLWAALESGCLGNLLPGRCAGT